MEKKQNKFAEGVKVIYDIWSDSKLIPLPFRTGMKVFHTYTQLRDLWKKEKNPLSIVSDTNKFKPFEGVAPFIYSSLQNFSVEPEIIFKNDEEDTIEKYKVGEGYVYFVLNKKIPSKVLYSSRNDLNFWSDWIWKKYDNRCSFSTGKSDDGYNNIPKLENFPVKNEEILEDEREAKIVKHWKCLRDDGFSRTIMLLGEPGTGKTSASVGAAYKLGGRLMHLSASSLAGWFDFSGFFKMLKLLKPNVLIVEDVHTLGHYVTKDLIQFLEWIRWECKNDTLVILTANEICHFSKALRRPGRIDEIVEFPLPDKEMRYKVLEFYAKKLKCFDSIRQFLEEFSYKSEGLSQAYLAEIVKFYSSIRKLYKNEEMKKIMDQKIDSMIVLLGKPVKQKEDSGETDTPSK